MTAPLEPITRLKEELDALRPLPPDVLAQVEQKLRLEANYNSNAIEGNTLTYGRPAASSCTGLRRKASPYVTTWTLRGTTPPSRQSKMRSRTTES